MLIQAIKKGGKKHVTKLKDMQNFFKNSSKYDANKEIYKVFVIEKEDLSYAITVINPGKINGEFFMTKGHYHKSATPEIYYLLNGEGLIIMQKGTEFKTIKMEKNEFYEIPEGYAHRTINTGSKPLEFLSIYLTKSGHDYKKIEKEGFKKRFY